MIIATIASWDIKALRWIHSLRKTGYNDKIIMFMDRNNPQISEQISKTYGVNIFPVEISPEKWSLPVNKLTWRWDLIKQLKLDENEDIIITDCYDVIFTKNPTQSFNKLTLSTEVITFREDTTGINVGWIQAVPQTANLLPSDYLDKPILNGGIIGGKAKQIIELCNKLTATPSGSDQSSLNILAMTGLDYEVNENWINCNSNFNKLNANTTILHANGDGYKSWIEQEFPSKNYQIILDRVMRGFTIQNVMAPTLTTYIPTRGRNNSTLPLTIKSILNSYVKPDFLVIFDDNEKSDFPKTIQYLLSEAKLKGIQVNLMKGFNKGQIAIHDYMNRNSFTDLIHRIDDDCQLEPDTLGKLISNFNNDVMAVTCSIIDPLQPVPANSVCDGTMKNILWQPNLQWSPRKAEVLQVEHLYSSFVYRRQNNVNYNMNLSQVGHREETMFSHELSKYGKLLVDTSTTIWHHRYPEGGIREGNNEMFSKDETVFMDWAKANNIQFVRPLFIQSCHGMGDDIVLRGIMPEIIETHKDKQVVVGTGFVEDWKKMGLNVIAINPQEFLALVGQQFYNQTSIYNFMGNLKSQGYILHIRDAYRVLYGLDKLENYSKENKNG